MKKIKWYFILTMTISIILETGYIISEKSMFAAILMFTPAVLAILFKVIFYQGEKNVLHFCRFKWKYLLAAILLPMFYIGIPGIILSICNPNTVSGEWKISLIINFVVSVLSNILLTLGEEIGWRGFLLPKLAEGIGERRALLLTGIIWGLWHCPLLIAGIYLPGISTWYKLPMFLLVIIAVGIVIGILTLRSGSIWPAVVMHAVHNTLNQNVLGSSNPIQCQEYLVGEVGILTVVIVVGVALWMLKKYYR